MSTSALSTAILLAATQSSGANFGVDGYLAGLHSSSQRSDYHSSHPLTLSGNAHDRAALYVWSWLPAGSAQAEWRFRFVRGSAPAVPAKEVVWPPQSAVGPLDPNLPHHALLHHPTGWRLAFVHGATGEITTRDLDTGLVWSIGLPPNTSSSWKSLQAVDDLDGDGADELLVHVDDSASGQTMLLDGRTGAVRWSRPYVAAATHVPAVNSGLCAPADIDGDSVPDLVDSTTSPGSGGALLQLDVVARSGADGAAIWSTGIPVQTAASVQPGPIRCLVGPDIDGDGIAEVGYLTFGAIGVLSGADGTSLWSLPLASLLPHLPPNAPGWIVPTDVLYWDRDPTDITRHTLCFIQELVGVGTYGSSNFITMQFDGETGLFTASLELPADLLPWAPLDPERPSSDHSWSRLGDLDRDGFAELSKAVATPLTGGGFLRNQAILGQRSMIGPETAHAGGSADIVLRVPSSPSHTFHVLASTGFGLHGGSWRRGWATHLTSSMLLAISAPASALTGTLDSAGRATVSVPIPAGAVSASRLVYFRGIVLEAGASGSIRTMTNLVTVAVMP